MKRMRNRLLKRWGLLLSAAVLAVLVGCQSVGGLNLNDVLLKQFDVASVESSSALEVNIDWNDDMLAGEDPELAKVLGWFEKTTLRIDQAKVSKDGRMLIRGSFGFGKGTIPFEMHSDNDKLLLNVDGAKHPLVISNADEQSLLGGVSGAGTVQDATPEMTEALRGIVKEAASYFIEHLPNPSQISVDRVSEPINGSATTLSHVHAELDGAELAQLIPNYLDAIAGDEEGLKAWLQRLLQLASELPPDALEALGTTPEELKAELDDANANLDDTVQLIVGEFKMLRETWDSMKQEDPDSFNQIFNASAKLKTDWYVDNDLRLRKSVADFSYVTPAEVKDELPFRSISVHSSEEIWNINGDVQVPEVSVPRDAYTPEELADLNPVRTVRLFEPDSVIYDLLKNEFAIDDQHFAISSEWGVPFKYGKDGKTLYVPLKSTLEEIGDQVAYEPQTKSYRFYDEATSQEVVLHLNSKEVTVNGRKTNWSEPAAIVIGGTAYVPAKPFFELVHAQYSLDTLQDGTKLLSVDRDL